MVICVCVQRDAQWLRAVVLAEDFSSVAEPLWWFTTIHKSSASDPMPFSDLWSLYTCGAVKTLIHKIK